MRASARVARGGTCGAIAPAKNIGTDNEELVRVECFAGSDELLPPAFGWVEFV